MTNEPRTTLCHGWYSNRASFLSERKTRLEYQPWHKGFSFRTAMTYLNDMTSTMRPNAIPATPSGTWNAPSLRSICSPLADAPALPLSATRWIIA